MNMRRRVKNSITKNKVLSTNEIITELKNIAERKVPGVTSIMAMSALQALGHHIGLFGEAIPVSQEILDKVRRAKDEETYE